MKKLFLLLIFLSFLSNNLYSQREVVIENFDNWSGGLPSGFEYYVIDSTWDGSVLQVSGHSGSAIKITNLYWDENNWGTTSASKEINIAGKVPDSVKLWVKESSPHPSDSRIMVFFLENGYNKAWFNEWTFLSADSITWSLQPFIMYGGTPGENFNKIIIDFEINRNASSNYEWAIYDDVTLVYNSSIYLTQPIKETKWFSGENEYIKFSSDDSTDVFRMEYSSDGGSSYSLIADSLKASDGKYEWTIPEIVTVKARIKITSLKTNDTAESENFKIKPYIITRLDNNGDYITYDIDLDRWGFGNTRNPNQVWPVWWWLRFNYPVNIDPFTNKPYSQRQGDSTFARAHMEEFPDWISFVNTFSVDRCYRSTTLGIYSHSALMKWNAIKRAWRGSCFGLSNANALAFERRSQFQNKYQDFPNFTDPINVTADTNVIPVINELWTHTLGNPAVEQRRYGNTLTVNETLEELKQMFRSDITRIQTLYIGNNTTGSTGAHSILPYHLERDPNNRWLYYLWVYDNSYPNNTTAIISIDSSAYMGSGRWDPIYGWNGWGGDKRFYLEGQSRKHLDYATIPKTTNSKNYFSIPSTVEIDIKSSTDIIISDSLGNTLSYQNDELVNEMPEAFPLLFVNGSKGPPYGYILDYKNYSVELNNFRSDTVSTYFFSDNKYFSYERYDANENQTDDLVYDGGVEIKNPDDINKTIRFMNIVDGLEDEKVFVIRELDLNKDESVKIIHPDEDNLEITSKGKAKTYDIELNQATELGLFTFNHLDVDIVENTTHLLRPNWGDFAALGLEILVDNGNDGTIDDTLHLEDQGTGVEEHGSNTLPTEYNLEQNYPNPFNASTKIRYSIPEALYVTIKVFNILGEEIAEIINEVKEIGNHTVSFDASSLTSGIYFYRITAGEFVETKKMVLMK